MNTHDGTSILIRRESDKSVFHADEARANTAVTKIRSIAAVEATSVASPTSNPISLR